MRYQNRPSSGMGIGIAIGAALGAATVLLFGRGSARRRALIRDKGFHFARLGALFGGKAARHARNRVVGGVEETRSKWRDSRRKFDDDILISRVRAQIGRDIRHMRLIDVAVEGDRVVIRGNVLYGEAAKLHDRLPKVRGVRDFLVNVSEHNEQELERISGFYGHTPETRASGF